jgi:hypothetical protein
MSITWRLYRDNGQINLFRIAVIAKIAPYRLATGTVSLLATGTTGRMASPVTQTPSIAVPLALMGVRIGTLSASKIMTKSLTD